MKPKETGPLLSSLAASAPIVPPVAILGVAFLGIGLLWLASDENKKPPEAEKVIPEAKKIPITMPSAPPVQIPTISARRVTREDVAEALAYGARRFTRKEAVESLKSLGFQKSSAYKALAPGGKFADLLEFTPDGLVEWKG